MANILIIEDNPMNAEMASELLRNAGHEAISTESAIEGIRLAKTKSPDLILMDLSLPEMDGLTATKILKQDPLTSIIPIVAFTALVMNSDREKAYGAGCSGFIPKPIEVTIFADTVEKFLKNNQKETTSPEKKKEKSVLSDYVIPKETKEKKYSKYNWHKVLIVDDNPMNAELLKETLEQIGQSSTIAYSGRKALEIVDTEKFDLILLDVMMPEISGFEVIKHLKKNPKTADVPVIFISALNETADIVKGLGLGSYGYITKPYNIEELKAKILNTLRIKDLQDQLRTETKKLELIYKFSVDGIVILNTSKEVTSCNDQFALWLEMSKDELIGKKFCSLVKCKSYTDGACNNQDFYDNLENDLDIVKEITIENSQTKLILEINFSKISNLESETEGFLLVIRDVTTLREIERQKETFVATLTHDLKTPIRAEIRALELLIKGNFGKLSPDQISIIQDTLHSSKYMFNMVDNLLCTYRYENGSVTLRKDNTDINQLAKSCYSELKYIAEDKKQEVIFDFQDEVLNVFVDVLEIKRVIMNLLANAVFYTPEKGKITIKSEINDKEFKISITDNGKGLSEEEMSKLFNKYTSYAKRFKQVGTGLGLYLCKQIVKKHDGQISVESQEGKGSTFTFSIPSTPVITPIG